MVDKTLPQVIECSRSNLSEHTYTFQLKSIGVVPT